MSIVLLLMGCLMEAVALPLIRVFPLKTLLAADYMRTAGTAAEICKLLIAPSDLWSAHEIHFFNKVFGAGKFIDDK